MGRVVVLCLDGLNFSLALKYKSLRQKEIGRVVINVPLITHVVWSSFLTGKMPSEHGVLPGSDAKSSRIKPGIKKIFDYASKPIVLWMPGWNPHELYWHPLHVKLCVKAGAGDHNAWVRYEKEILSLFYSQRSVVMSMLERDFDLLMAHFNIIDAIGHALHDTNKMDKYVILVAKMVSDIKSKLNGDYRMLLISDHGVEHTPDAFYSCNVKLGLKNPKITDFFEIIKNWLEC